MLMIMKVLVSVVGGSVLSILTACSDIKEMVKRDLEIERRRAVADSKNNPY